MNTLHKAYALNLRVFAVLPMLSMSCVRCKNSLRHSSFLKLSSKQLLCSLVLTNSIRIIIATPRSNSRSNNKIKVKWNTSRRSTMTGRNPYLNHQVLTWCARAQKITKLLSNTLWRNIRWDFIPHLQAKKGKIQLETYLTRSWKNINPLIYLSSKCNSNRLTMRIRQITN